MNGIFFGIGVGPGDPELLTVKAINTIADCDVIAVPDSGADNQIALGIVRKYIGKKPVMLLDLPMIYDNVKLQELREIAADSICTKLDKGKNVGFLTIGDPMIFSTYSYLHTMIISRGYVANVIPGVTSFCAAAAALGQPLCEGGQSLHIIPTIYNTESALSLGGTKILMKSGKKLVEVIDLLKEKNICAKIAQRVGMEGEKLFHNLNSDVKSDYFSIIIIKEQAE